MKIVFQRSKRILCILLAVSLLCGVLCFGTSAAQGGQITEDLSWSFVESAGLRITGTGTAIPDYEQGQAPWQSVAGNIFKITLPNQIESIGNFAFYGCANLHSVELPEHLTRIGDKAFRDSGLESLELPYNLKSIGEESFAGSIDLQSIRFNVLHSGGMGVEKIDGLKEIGTAAFAFCSSLENVELPETLECIGTRAFDGCSDLITVSFVGNGKALQSIGAEAFNDCTSLEKITIPESITAIEEAAFRNTALTEVKLHAAIESVADRAFFGCDKLKRIDVYNTACTFADSDMVTPDGATLYALYAAKNTASYAKKYAKPLVILCIGRTASHSFKKTVTKASAKVNGEIKNTCKSCNYSTAQTIAKIKTVKLTKTAFTYNGKVQNPTASMVQVLDSNGKVIVSSNYTVARVKTTDGRTVGQHAVKITMKGDYEGSFVRYYQILPKGTAIKAAAAGKGAIKFTWARQTVQTTGYQIRLCKNAKFSSGVKTYTIKNNKTLTYTVKKLSRKTGYYTQIRTFKTIKGKHYFSAWSKSFGRKTK